MVYVTLCKEKSGHFKISLVRKAAHYFDFSTNF